MTPALYREIAEVFGAGPNDEEVARRAKAFGQLFVRSQTHVGILNDGSRGRQLTAFECLHAFGRETMAELAEHLVTPFVREGTEVAPILKARREAVGVAPEDVVDKLARVFPTTVAVADLVAMEEGRTKIPARLLARWSRILALDAWTIGAEEPAGIGSPGATRPAASGASRSIGDRDAILGPRDALDLAEATWSIATWTTLDGWMEGAFARRGPADPDVDPTGDLTGADALATGRDMAGRLRVRAGLSAHQPIEDVVSFCIARAEVPVVCVAIDGSVAGAAVRQGGVRGVVVNTEGGNLAPEAFRFAVAHGLFHALREGRDAVRLASSALVRSPPGPDGERGEALEIAAVAFASELLLPRAAATGLRAEGGGSLERIVEHFGVDVACALRQGAPEGVLASEPRKTDAGDRTVRPSSRWAEMRRAGIAASRDRFEDVCFDALDRNLISADSCGDMILVDLEDADGAASPSGSGVEPTPSSGAGSPALNDDEWTVLLAIYVGNGLRVPSVNSREIAEASRLLPVLNRPGETRRARRPPAGLRGRMAQFDTLKRSAATSRPPPAGAATVWRRYHLDRAGLDRRSRRIRLKAALNS